MTTTRRKNFLLILAATLLPGLLWPLLTTGHLWLPGLAAGIVLAAADWFFPALTAPLWRATRKIGHGLGHVSGVMLMTALYVAVIVPAGLVFQIVSSMTSRKKATADAETFFQPADAREKDHMRRMF